MWKYNLNDGGASLRKLVRSEDMSPENCANIIEQMKVCCIALKHKLVLQDRADLGEQLNEFIELIADEPDILRSTDKETEDILLDMGFDGSDPRVELVNDRLNQFYDLCDECRCWVGWGFGES